MSVGAAPLSGPGVAGEIPELDPQQRLAGALRRYDRRRRLQQTVAWLPRALLVALALGIGLAVAARLRPLLTNGQVGLIALGAAAGAVALCLLFLWLRRTPNRILARRFDLDFDLRERVSTALALIAGEIRTVGWLAERQIADAADQAAAALTQLAERLPLPFRLRDWLTAIVLLVVLVILLILPNPAADALERSGALDSAIAEAGQTLEQIAEAVAADPALDAEERQALLEELRRQIEALENPEVSAEEAFASLSEMSAELQERSEGLAQRAGQTQEALEQMAAALREATGGEPGDNSEAGDPAGAMEQVTQNLEEIAERAGAMSPEEQQRAAQALQDAAAALQQSNPQESTSAQQQQSAEEALRNAAEALERGDLQQLQQDLAEANEQLQQNANQAQQQSQSRQELSEAAQEARDAASEISQAQQQQAQAQQQAAQQEGGQEGERGMPQQGEAAAEQQGGLQTLGEQGSQQSPDGQLSESGALAEPQVRGPGQQDSQQDGPGVSAGDAAGTSGSDGPPQTAGEQATVGQDNDPDGTGERAFEAINVPRRIGGAFGDDAIILEADPSDSPVQEGDFADNPEGQVTVEYDQVYGIYRDAADRALDSGYVPLTLRDVVRDYFTSLEPNR